MEAVLPRPALRGPALVLSAVVGFALVGAGLGGWFAVVVAAVLCWLWWGRGAWLAAVLALALALASVATKHGPSPTKAPASRGAPATDPG